MILLSYYPEIEIIIVKLRKLRKLELHLGDDEMEMKEDDVWLKHSNANVPSLSLKLPKHYKGPFLSRIIIVSIFLFLSACSTPTPNQALKNTYWNLVELNGEDSNNADHQPNVHLVFHINDKSLHGSDGCNSIRANYTKHEESFAFSNIISTRLNCKEGMSQAQAFIEVLKKADSLYIYENDMFLYHEQVQIARFEAKEDY